MSNLVIVALPREDDPVWKISSEKKPHLTILFLGSANNPNRDQIAQFLMHAVNTMAITRFGLDVDRRGELGEDKADVLFFQDNWELPRLRDFRDQLLKDTNIKKAYDSVEQFDGWTPHLTLGYPEKPAKPTSERIYWVQFDRIALWDSDYEGVELILKNDYSLEVAMSDTAAAGRQFLAHYGVKGMKWGVRKDRTTRDVTAESVVRAGLRGKTKVKVGGGQAHPATQDAVKAAIQKQKLRKSGPAALSNQELRELTQRIQLEQQAVALATPKAQKFIKEQLLNQGKQTTTRVISDVSNTAYNEAKASRKK